MLLKTIRKFLKKFHLFGCHQKKNDEFPANQSTVLRPWPHTDEPRQQKVTMSSLNSNWVNISYWQQQQYCGYIFTAPTVTRDKKHHHQQEEQEKYGRDRNVLRPETGNIAFIDLAWVVISQVWESPHKCYWLGQLICVYLTCMKPKNNKTEALNPSWTERLVGSTLQGDIQGEKS